MPFSRRLKAKRDFEKIYDAHVEQIFRFVYLKVSSKDDAEDITSKVFLKLWEAVSKKKEVDIKNPRAFLYRVARNMVIDYYRKNREDEDETPKKNKAKKTPIEKVVVVDKEMRADERAMLDSQIEEIRSALSNINEDYQNIIIWYYLDELTTSEIANLLEKPEASVRVLIHRSLSALKKELKEDEV